MLKKLHHVAYRCRDAAETVEFYTKVIGLPFSGAFVQDFVPSIRIPAPHCHVFFQMEDGSYIAFFEILGSTERMVPVEHDWAQHLALEVASEERAETVAARLRARGGEVNGPVKHGAMSRSWYFFDPSGHRLEMYVRQPEDHVAWEKLKTTADADMARWQARKSKQALTA
jgi:glyoxylase I family protein